MRIVVRIAVFISIWNQLSISVFSMLSRVGIAQCAAVPPVALAVNSRTGVPPVSVSTRRRVQRDTVAAAGNCRCLFFHLISSVKSHTFILGRGLLKTFGTGR